MISIFALASQSCVIWGDGEAVLTVDNASSYALYELSLTPVAVEQWGEDLLRGDPLLPGERINIYDIDCDTYDVRVEDQSGVDCVLKAVTLCFDAQVWVITDRTLAACDRFGSV